MSINAVDHILDYTKDFASINKYKCELLKKGF